jgi:hypothetical protein
MGEAPLPHRRRLPPSPVISWLIAAGDGARFGASRGLERPRSSLTVDEASHESRGKTLTRENNRQSRPDSNEAPNDDQR